MKGRTDSERRLAFGDVIQTAERVRALAIDPAVQKWLNMMEAEYQRIIETTSDRDTILEAVFHLRWFKKWRLFLDGTIGAGERAAEWLADNPPKENE